MGKMILPYNEDNLPFVMIYKHLFCLSPSAFSIAYYHLQKTGRFQTLTIKEISLLADLFMKKMDIQYKMKRRDAAIEEILDMTEPDFLNHLANNTLPKYVPLPYYYEMNTPTYSGSETGGDLYMNRHMLRYMCPSDFIIKYTK
jgi:hypothetical protein